jgi:hypothetical protein
MNGIFYQSLCRIFLPVAACLLLYGGAYGQDFSSRQLREWSRNPVWVGMMDDPTANYFEVVAAYEAFWKDREMPVEEDQILRVPREKRDHEYTRRELHQRARKERKMEKEEREAAIIRHQFTFDVKRYKHWKLTVEPYVQPDGRILSKEEQLELHKTQRP